MSSEWKSGRHVYLVEISDGKKPSTRRFDDLLTSNLPQEYDPTVWGLIEGVDPAYRKLRQLSRETEEERSKEDRIHSAHKALSFFREMFPPAFWKWKLIGEDHPTTEQEQLGMAGR